MRLAGAKGGVGMMSGHRNEHKHPGCTCQAGLNLLLSAPVVNTTVE